MPDLISAGIGIATGTAKTVANIIKAAKTKQIAKELELSRPEYQISDTAGQDLDLTESELAKGMSSRAETAYNNLNNQQFASSLSAILRGGGSTNNVAEVYGNSEDGRQRLALLNDQIRMQQIDRLMKTRSMYRDEQDKEWQINDFAPWEDKKVANAEARQNAQNGIWDGIGTIANAGMNYFGGKNQEKIYDKYFSRPTSSMGTGTRATPMTGFRPNMSDVGTSYPPFKPFTPGFNPNENPESSFVMPDYLMDENWAQGAHNMF